MVTRIVFGSVFLTKEYLEHALSSLFHSLECAFQVEPDFGQLTYWLTLFYSPHVKLQQLRMASYLNQ